MTSAKVIGLHGIKAPKGQSAQPLPKEFLKLRDHCKDRIRALLIDLFNNADDALFAMSDKADSNNEQAVYFEAMRELRLQKKTIVLSTLGAVVRSFTEFGTAPQIMATETEEHNLDELSLVDDERLEYDVAIDSMVQRVRSEATEDLGPFKARIAHLFGKSELADEQMPMSPEVLCNGFVDGCADLEADIKAKLIVFKLFERYVLSEASRVYSEMNQLLITMGVLPEFKQRYRRKSNPSAPTHSSFVPRSNEAMSGEADSAHQGGDGIGVDLGALRELLHPQGEPLQTGGLSAGYSATNIIPQQDILNTLSLFQSAGTDSIANYASNNEVIDFQKLIAERLGGTAQDKACNDLDADVINLVSMLFEFILEDRQLQAEMKAVISRLQIPLLKVALMDKSFFSKGGHPARKLLNEIASSAIGWNPPRGGRRDRYKEKLESVVEQVTEGFSDDVSMFDALLSDFEEFVDAERRRGLLVEQRTRDSERGKAAAEQARKAAQEAINSAIHDKAVPDLGMELLKDAWSKVLVFKYLREGAESDAWKGACQVIEELVWSLCPDPNEPDARAKLLRSIPVLVKKLRSGFEEVALDESLSKALLSRLEDQHVLSLQALQQQVDLAETAANMSAQEPERLDAAELLAEQNDEVSDLVRSTLELEEDFKQLQEVCEQADEKQSSAKEQNEKLPKKQEDVVLVEEQPNQATSEIADDSPFLQQVDRFVVGCWFEFAGGEASERCKLAAVIRSTGKHIFVNRAGVKVAEKTRVELAQDLKAGSLQVLNDGLLFDRALESIITNLRS